MRLGLIAAGLALLVGVSAALALPARWTPAGKPDFTYGSAASAAGGPATASKPESKLFYTPDRRWWAVLGTSGGGSVEPGVYLSELRNHVWRRRVRLRRSDPWDKADALFHAPSSTLYVTLRDNRVVHGSPRASKLYRLVYRRSSWRNVRARPAVVTRADPETLTVARDTVGRLWVTWREGGAIRVGFLPRRARTFRYLALPATPVSADDISAITAFGTRATGGKIGVLWSDQVAARFWFAWRSDRDPPLSRAWRVETAYGAGVGGCPTLIAALCSDDHINLKAHGDTVYAAVKTGLNDAPTPAPNDPLIVLLRRDAAGVWGAWPVSPVRQRATRPVVLLAPSLNGIYVFARRRSGVHVWESPLSAPGFNPDGLATWTAGAGTNDPTSTKQVVGSRTGAVVETSLDASFQYWHNEFLP